jgi:16S rRNA (guanine966-N2)-methyltransferase
MTRVIAGSLKGRRLLVPDEGVRPTSDKVREAIFSSLQSRFDFEGARVLDLFAGTGALGIEALSRGAQFASLVESSTATARTLKKNIESLSLTGNTQVVVRKVGSYLNDALAANRAQADSSSFDLVFLDPPYDLEGAEVDAALSDLANSGLLAPGAMVVIERPTTSTSPTWPEAIDEQLCRTYGDTTVWYGEMCR